MRRRVTELRKNAPAAAAVPETDEGRKERLAFDARLHNASRAGTVRRLEMDNGLSEPEANSLVDGWEREAEIRKIGRRDPDFWRQGDQWMAPQLMGRQAPESDLKGRAGDAHEPVKKRPRSRATSSRATTINRES